jgi:hypothetical protein
MRVTGGGGDRPRAIRQARGGDVLCAARRTGAGVRHWQRGAAPPRRKLLNHANVPTSAQPTSRFRPNRKLLNHAYLTGSTVATAPYASW